LASLAQGPDVARRPADGDLVQRKVGEGEAVELGKGADGEPSGEVAGRGVAVGRAEDGERLERLALEAVEERRANEGPFKGELAEADGAGEGVIEVAVVRRLTQRWVALAEAGTLTEGVLEGEPDKGRGEVDEEFGKIIAAKRRERVAAGEARGGHANRSGDLEMSEGADRGLKLLLRSEL
jgi:hypothetical protein